MCVVAMKNLFLKKAITKLDINHTITKCYFMCDHWTTSHINFFNTFLWTKQNIILTDHKVNSYMMYAEFKNNFLLPGSQFIYKWHRLPSICTYTVSFMKRSCIYRHRHKYSFVKPTRISQTIVKRWILLKSLSM